MEKVKKFFNGLSSMLLFVLLALPWVLFWIWKKSNIKETIFLKQTAKVKKTKTKGYSKKKDVQSLSKAVKSAKDIIKNF